MWVYAYIFILTLHSACLCVWIEKCPLCMKTYIHACNTLCFQHSGTHNVYIQNYSCKVCEKTPVHRTHKELEVIIVNEEMWLMLVDEKGELSKGEGGD